MTAKGHSSMRSDSEIRLRRTPSGAIVPGDFEQVSIDPGAPQAGEVIVRPMFLSLDPYLSIQMYGRSVRGQSFAPGDAIRSRMVGTVVESRDPRLSPGVLVRGTAPWSTLCRLNGEALEQLRPDGTPPELFLSVLGVSGITAWVGLHRVARISADECVIVSGAAGTIGSIAGQLARRHGCRVVGIAGGAEKQAHVEGLGFGPCLDYRAADFSQRLSALAAQVYFENVGGTLLDAVLPALDEHARIALCGMIAHYDSGRTHNFRNLHLLLERAIEVRPYRVSEHARFHQQAMRELATAVADGTLRCAHTIADGLGAAPQAFCQVMSGKTFGKALVRLGDGYSNLGSPSTSKTRA